MRLRILALALLQCNSRCPQEQTKFLAGYHSILVMTLVYYSESIKQVVFTGLSTESVH